MSTINCKGKLIDLSTPQVMGILNLTPDSFYDGGKYQEIDEIISKTDKMLAKGATFIDIGAYSSRPGADFVSEEEESSRLIPIIKLLVKEFPEILISVDTFRGSIAKTAVEEGATLINDITAGEGDPLMMKTIAELQVPYIMMHMRGDSKTMQNLTNYKNVLKEINLYFAEKVNKARSLGINDLILDPGFGFAKTINQNFKILKNLDFLKIHELPLLIGVSRKSMIYKSLKVNPEEALNGTTVLNTVALLNGATILRVHDVKEAKESIDLVKLLLKNKNS